MEQRKHQTGAGTGATEQSMTVMKPYLRELSGARHTAGPQNDFHESYNSAAFSSHICAKEPHETIPESFKTATGCSYENFVDQCQQKQKVQHCELHPHMSDSCKHTQTGAKLTAHMLRT